MFILFSLSYCLKCHQRSLEMNDGKSSLSLVLSLSKILRDQSEFEGALDFAREAVKTAEMSMDAWISIASCHLDMESFDAALLSLNLIPLVSESRNPLGSPLIDGITKPSSMRPFLFSL